MNRQELVPSEVPAGQLTTGDILNQNIGSYDALKKGTLLTPDTIRLVVQLMGNKPVAILREEETRRTSATARATHAAVTDKEQIADMISERIDAAFKKDRAEVTGENLEEFSSLYNLGTSEMDSADQVEAAKIINSIDEISKEIAAIESGPKETKTVLLQKLTERVKMVDSVYTGILSARQEAVKALEKITSDFLDETGPNRESSILLKDIMDQRANYIGNHCLNVAVVSLATAIELTKIMEQKLTSKEITKDLGILRTIKFKSFSREELIKLGFAAFVHDIFLKKVFPDLKYNSRINSQRDLSQVERHASESYHLMKQFEMDYHVNKAVLQHHERMDGSGTPDGVNGRMFSKYTAIISFADRYISLTQPNPFTPNLHPTAAIKRMLTAEKEGFDSDVMIAFARAATMIPIGSWVQLEDGMIGYSCRPVPGSNLPLVRTVIAADGTALPAAAETDPSFPGQRINRLLTKEEIARLNQDWESLYIL